MSRDRSAKILSFDLAFGLVLIGVGLWAYFLWIPEETVTGWTFTARRRLQIGDSFAPNLAALLLTLAGIGVAMKAVLASLNSKRVKGASLEIREDEPSHDFRVLSPVVIGLLFIIFAVSIFMMLNLGLWITASVGPDKPYIELRTTMPWNLIGYVSGGALLVLSLVSSVERRVSLRGILVAIGAPLAFAFCFEVLLDDLFLPPNGDMGSSWLGGREYQVD